VTSSTRQGVIDRRHFLRVARLRFRLPLIAKANEIDRCP
jgi:hypothetical protein